MGNTSWCIMSLLVTARHCSSLCVAMLIGCAWQCVSIVCGHFVGTVLCREGSGVGREGWWEMMHQFWYLCVYMCALCECVCMCALCVCTCVLCVCVCVSVARTCIWFYSIGNACVIVYHICITNTFALRFIGPLAAFQLCICPTKYPITSPIINF